MAHVIAPLHSTPARYGFALLTCVVASAVTALAMVMTSDSHVIAALLAAILLTGWYAGAGPAVFALALGLFADGVLSTTLGGRHGMIPNAHDIWFVLFAVGAARFGTARRQMTTALETANDQLESAVVERTEELHRNQRYLEEAERLSDIGTWTRPSHPGLLQYWSEGAFRILGLDPASAAPSRQLLRSMIHPDDRAWATGVVDRAVPEGRSFDVEHRIIRPDGEERIVRIVGQPWADDSGAVVEYVGVVIDLTERRRAERELRAAQTATMEARFAARLAERNRLAREMHDTLLQGFTGVALQLLAVTNRIRASKDDVDDLRGVIGLAQRTLEDARRAIWDIRVPLDADQLPAALRETTEEVLRETSVSLDFRTVGDVRALDAGIETTIARITREAVTNAVKHAAATEIRVRLAYRRGCVRVTVVDDGHGFVFNRDLRAYGGHWGLLGMRERAANAGGSLSVRSRPGRGTVVSFVAPV